MELGIEKIYAKMPFRISSMHEILGFQIIIFKPFFLIFDYESLPPRITSENVEENLIANDLSSHVRDSEMEMKDMTVEKYNELVQLIPQIEKLKETIRKMTLLIETKNTQIDELKKVNSFANLKDVSISPHFQCY